MKPSICKQDGRWRLTRPGYGFAPEPVVTEHGSWKAAKDALLGDAVGSAGPIVERGQVTFRSDYWGPPRGTIRMGRDRGRKCHCGNYQPCPNPACAPPKVPPPPPPPSSRGTIRMEETA